MMTRKFFKLLTLSVLLTLCLTVASGAVMSDEEFLNLCENGTVKDIRNALLKGINPNAKDKNGMTALMNTAWKNSNPKAISLLLNVGADVNAKTKGGMTALMFAVYNNIIPEVVSVLLNAGADVNAKDNNGMTALMGATINNQEAVSLLLNAGADVNAKDNNGVTALMWAAYSNMNPEVVSILMKAGAVVNAKDDNGVTALDYALRIGNAEAVKVLTEAGTATDPESLYQLGVKYTTGDGVEEDEKKGLELLRKAAEQGNQKAKDALKLFE